jgi:hypothetical protein
VLLAAAVVALGIGYVATDPETKQICYSLSTGLLSSTFVAIVTDITGKKFFAETLQQFEISMHEGGLMHSSHKHVPSREEAVRKYFRKRRTAKIITLTASQYLEDDTVVKIIQERIEAGAEMRLLLHAPLYYLRSRVDMVGGAVYGPRHLTALDIVRRQNLMIPLIERLVGNLHGRFKVCYFTVQLHARVSIWGRERIFASPVLRDASGDETPCIEVFHGLRDSLLFKKFERDFDYVWSRPDLTLSLAEVKSFYHRIVTTYPDGPDDLEKIDDEFIRTIEREVAAIQRARRRDKKQNPD